MSKLDYLSAKLDKYFHIGLAFREVKSFCLLNSFRLSERTKYRVRTYFYKRYSVSNKGKELIKLLLGRGAVSNYKYRIGENSIMLYKESVSLRPIFEVRDELRREKRKTPPIVILEELANNQPVRKKKLLSRIARDKHQEYWLGKWINKLKKYNILEESDDELSSYLAKRVYTKAMEERWEELKREKFYCKLVVKRKMFES